MWMHREPEHNAYFFTIMTEYGKMLRLSGKHLIFKTLCDSILVNTSKMRNCKILDIYNEYIEILPTKAVYADQLRVGDCVIVLKKVSVNKNSNNAEKYQSNCKQLFSLSFLCYFMSFCNLKISIRIFFTHLWS